MWLGAHTTGGTRFPKTDSNSFFLGSSAFLDVRVTEHSDFEFTTPSKDLVCEKGFERSLVTTIFENFGYRSLPSVSSPQGLPSLPFKRQEQKLAFPAAARRHLPGGGWAGGNGG